MNKAFLLLALSGIIVWVSVDSLCELNQYSLPSLRGIAISVADGFTSGEILHHSFATVNRALIATCIALLIGGSGGMIAGTIRLIGDAVCPAVDFFRAIPTSMLFPLFILSIGIGEAAKIGIAVCATAPIFFVVLFAVFRDDSLNDLKLYSKVHGKRIRSAWFLRLSMLWNGLPAIISGLKISISVGLVIVIVSEMFFIANEGLGWAANMAYQGMKIDLYYSYIILTGGIGMVLNFGLDKIIEAVKR